MNGSQALVTTSARGLGERPGEGVRAVVVRFPGSNCDADALYALEALGAEARGVWHTETDLGDADLVVLPGGFSYGDYLRSGAMAALSPVMTAVGAFAERGGLVLGVCNGFQILCEAGLLPGALARNTGLHFVCERVYVRVENAETAFTSLCGPGEVLALPVAHGEGRYVADAAVLERLRAENRVVFRYCAADGSVTDAADPNGSMDHIAGILNGRGNVCGLMPHPERAVEALLGGADGRTLFASAFASLTRAS